MDTDNNMVATRGKRAEGSLIVKGGQYMVTDDDLTLGAGRTVQYPVHLKPT